MPHLNFSQTDVENLRRKVQEFGFGFLPNPVPREIFAKLEHELTTVSDAAVTAKRAGAVNYQAKIAALASDAKAFLSGAEMKGLLRSVFDQKLTLNEEMSCYTLYHEGDHLGPHRDEPPDDCWVTTILYLDVRHAKNIENTGLVLHIFAEDIGDGRNARLSIPTAPGMLVVGLGARYWHERPLLALGEYVAALTACYRLQ